MRIAAPSALLVAALVAGCAQNQAPVSAFFLTPYKLEDLTCKELKQRAADVAKRLQRSTDLRQRASASAAGPVIGTVVYGPDYQKAMFEQRAYEHELARKNCAAEPDPEP